MSTIIEKLDKIIAPLPCNPQDMDVNYTENNDERPIDQMGVHVDNPYLP